MSFLEALLLALALCVDSLVVSTTTAFKSKMPWRQGALMAFVFGLCQAGFPLLGALIGDVARAFIEAVDHWVAFGLLAFIGVKMIFDGIKNVDDKEESEKQAIRRSPLSTYFLFYMYEYVLYIYTHYIFLILQVLHLDFLLVMHFLYKNSFWMLFHLTYYKLL